MSATQSACTTVKHADIHRRRLPLYLIGSGFLLLLVAEVWVKLV